MFEICGWLDNRRGFNNLYSKGILVIFPLNLIDLVEWYSKIGAKTSLLRTYSFVFG